MSKLLNYDKKIKKIIEDDHDGLFYDNDELTDAVNSILVEVKKECDTDHETLAETATYFVYYSDKNGKYYLNHKRRQPKKKDYHETLLSNLLKPKVEEIEEEEEEKEEEMKLVFDKVGVFEVNNDKGKEELDEEEQKENMEPTSEELAQLEKEIFSKNEKKVVIKKKEMKEMKVVEMEEVNDDYIKQENYLADLHQDYIEENMLYEYPKNYPFKPDKKYYFEPYGTQWLHDKQIDDVITDREIKLGKQFDVLRAIKLPEQRSAEWFEMRDGKITASDGGTVIDVNPHEQQFKFILKKTIGLPFISNVFVYHGKKLEEIAILIYEYRMNIKCEAFGLIGHPKYKFLGASPDSIAGKYKLNGQNKSKFVGRMLEIKCPYVRKIKTEGPIIDYICPIYYWVQVQLQLECCDLEECDFWQCELREYNNREDFIADTHPTEPFRSKETSFEKGCLIQLLPKSKMADILDGKYDTVVWDDAMFIYPPKIEMTPYDCDLWIAQTMCEIQYKDEYRNHFFDQVIYWKLVVSKNVLINRDRKWFAESLPIFEKMWNYVLFFRKNKDKLDLLIKYIESRPVKKNKLIMSVVEKIYNVSDPDYKNIIDNIMEDIKNVKKKVEYNDDDDGYMFITKDEPKATPVSGNSKPKIIKKKQDTDDDDDYMFIAPKKPAITTSKPIITNKSTITNKPGITSKPTITNKPAITTNPIKKPSIVNKKPVQDDDDGYSFI